MGSLTAAMVKGERLGAIPCATRAVQCEVGIPSDQLEREGEQRAEERRRDVVLYKFRDETAPARKKSDNLPRICQPYEKYLLVLISTTGDLQ